MTPDPEFRRWIRGGLWGLIVAGCALTAYEIPNRGIDPDELEHLHAASCVSRGEVPYRDFFEHHGPALYYLMLPVMKVCGQQLSALWLGRLMMWCCALAVLWLTGRLAGRWADDRVRLLAMALLAWTNVFQAKGIELRPDVPATLLLIVSVGQFTYATGGGSWRRFLYVGLLCGLAALLTQKAIVPAGAIGAAACVARLVTRAPATESPATVVARTAVPFAAGIAAVWGVATLLFATAGAADAFWYSTCYQLWIWPVRSGRWETLRPELAADFTVWVCAAIEICAVLRQWRDPETWKAQRGAAAFVAACCIASVAIVKATYPQFYLLWMPLLAALAARRVVAWCERVAARRALWLAIVASGECLVLMQFMLWRRAFWAGPAGALPRLAEIDHANTGLLLILTAALIGIAALARARQAAAAVLFAGGLGMGYSVMRSVDAGLWSNRDQVAAIEAVNRIVPVDGRVLDGFTGYAALRRHAWYYWWINEYSLALVPEAERETRLIEALEESPPAAVLFDENIELLPQNVRDWIIANYEPSEPAVLWLPRRMPAQSSGQKAR